MFDRMVTVLIAFSAIYIQAAIHTVAIDGSADYASVQEAVNAATAGDTVEILDFSIYNEQITIDSTKQGLTLRASNPASSIKPVILWQDKVNVGPKDTAQAKIDSLITFDRNGAVRIIQSKDVTIEGIVVDGGGPYVFAYPSIWKSSPTGLPSPLFHGNTALTIFLSSSITIRNCESQNAYFGIYIKDRINRGIFSNPEDTVVQSISYYSGFDHGGNHLVESNRIHNNSWGLFFESSFDLSSTVRYNLIYENHHPSIAFETKVQALPDGTNQPGGALLFKDVPLSPVAIYNNTFWHNFATICGHWQPGSQHLIFNNIFGKPNIYWSSDSVFNNPFNAMDGCFTNRMHHCVYACQSEKAETVSRKYSSGAMDTVADKFIILDTIITGVNYIKITNGMNQVENVGQDIVMKLHLSTHDTSFSLRADWVIQPGALITKPFSKDATIRWLETDPLFKSTDPKNPDFLVPDWDNALVKQFILDQGWQEAGIKDVDGSIADLGAIPKEGIPKGEIVVKATSPVTIAGTQAIATFKMHSFEGTITNPKIKYVTWIKNLPFEMNSFGGSMLKPIPAANITSIPIPSTQVNDGNNSLSFTIPATETPPHFAMLEMIIEGDVNGKTVTSNVGFLPFRLTNDPPLSAAFTKKQTSENQILFYEIFDLRGRVIKKINSNQLRLNYPNLLQHSTSTSKGIYILRAVNRNGTRDLHGINLLVIR